MSSHSSSRSTAWQQPLIMTSSSSVNDVSNAHDITPSSNTYSSPDRSDVMVEQSDDKMDAGHFQAAFLPILARPKPFERDEACWLDKKTSTDLLAATWIEYSLARFNSLKSWKLIKNLWIFVVWMIDFLCLNKIKLRF